MDKGEGRGGRNGEEEVGMGRGGENFVRGHTYYYIPTDEGTSLHQC